MKRIVVPVLAAAFIVLSCVIVNTGVRGDGNGYFAWVASAVIDHDLDFSNQYAHANALFTGRVADATGVVTGQRVAETGLIENQWAVGPSVLWTPWFLAAHAVVRLKGEDPQDGFAPRYRRFCAIGTMFYGLLCLVLSVRASRRLGVSQEAAWLAAASVWGASSILLYAYLLPFHVHTLAAFTVALFFCYWIESGGVMSRRQWAVSGALAGLMGLTYYVDSVLVVVMLPIALAEWRTGKLGRLAGNLAAFGACAMLVASPQWIGKWIVYGSPFRTGYKDHFLTSGFEWWRTALSTNHGVLLWTPIVAVGLLGLVLLARRRRDMAWIVIASAVFYCVIASYDVWHGLSSFGNRFFVSLTLPMIVGVSVLIDTLWRRGTAVRTAVVAGLTCLVLWNAGLAFQWASKMVPNRGPVAISKVASQQLLVPARFRELFWRYLTDREALTRQIEEMDRQEWERYQKIR